MKNNQVIGRQGQKIEKKQVFAPGFSGAKFSVRRAQSGFTLIELLVVISIIAVLAAFTIPVLSSVARKKTLDRTRSEMEQLATAIESYKAAYGFYPPSNPGYPANTNNAMFNPLYFELLGTTNVGGVYKTLDGSASINVANLAAVVGVSGFVNCSKSGASEDAPAARNFLPSLNSNRYRSGITNNADPSNPVTLLLASVGGSDIGYQPVNTLGANPWRYVSPGVNNPSSYDLWVQVSVGSSFSSVNNFIVQKKYLICNWSKQPQLNSPLP